MTYDDDTGRRVHLDIRPEDRPDEPGKPSQPPSQQVQDLILEHARRHREWGPDRIHAHFRKIHNRHDITLNVVRWVLSQKKSKQRG